MGEEEEEREEGIEKGLVLSEGRERAARAKRAGFSFALSH